MRRGRQFWIDYYRRMIAETRRPEIRRWLALGAAGTLVAAIAIGIGTVAGLRRGLPTAEELGRIGQMDQATAVFDASDQLAFSIFKEQRIEVPLDRVSPHVIDALVSMEDKRFYSHHGFDWVRMGGATLANLRHLAKVEGASTITQQLARMSFLTPNKTLRRKFQELILARRIERQFSKQEILHLYLNKAYFGDGLYGIEAAARGYFAKPASELSAAESALLVGLVKSPTNYAPTVRLARAVARRNLVLKRMAAEGVLDSTQLAAAINEKVRLEDGLHFDEPVGLYFKEQIRQELVERFGWPRVHQGGLRVFATIDMRMQRAAEASVAEGLKSLDKRRETMLRRQKRPDANADPLQAALFAMNPKTGHVLAMVGGRDYEKSRFNRAIQAKRQPGSAFKPFVYAAALEAGYTPATIITNLNDPIDTPQGAWTPDDEHGEEDAISMRVALRTSSNRAAVRLLEDVGIPKTVDYAKTLGVGDVPSVPSLALGSGEVTLQSLTAAYGAFANNGSVPRPIIIRRVEDRDGQVLFAAEVQATQAVAPTTAYLMANMMADVVNAGTAAGIRARGFTLPAAGKTGTTNDYHDAWFVGFTPSLVAGVWVGFDQPRTILLGGYASDVAVPVWTSFMKAATAGAKAEWLPAPRDIVTASVCRLSGKLASEGCEHAHTVAANGTTSAVVYTEYFARGTEPTSYCTMHPTAGFIQSLVAVFKGADPPAPPHVEPPAVHPPEAESAAATGDTPAVAASVPEPAPPKKRGFWSRVFGR